MLLIDSHYFKIRVARVNRMPGNQFFTQFFFGVNAQTYLPKKTLEAIILKQLFVVRRVIVHAIHRFLEPFRHKPPPAVTISEIDWTIHGFYLLLLQPLFGGIKKEVCSFAVVYAIIEANTTNGHIVSFIFISLVGKCGYAAHEFVVPGFKDPSFCRSEPVSLVLFFIKYIVDILVEWPYIIWIALINSDINQ